MAGSPVSFTDVVQLGINSALDRVHVARPGKVTAYDPVTNTVVVKPCVSRALYSASTGERSYEELPEIPFVPVVWPRAGGYILRTPIDAGDTVLLVFNDVSLAEWRETGELAEPVDARRHSLGWPVAIPGLFPDTSPPDPLDAAEVAAGAAIFGQDGGANQLIIGGTIPGFRFGKLAVSPVALAVPLLAYVSAAAAAGTAGGASDSAVSAALTAIQAALAAIVAIPANAAAAPAVAASGAAVGTAGTSTAASAAAATAASAAAATAAGAVPSTLVKAL